MWNEKFLCCYFEHPMILWYDDDDDDDDDDDLAWLYEILGAIDNKDVLNVTLDMLGKISADDILRYFSYFFQNWVRYLVQIVSWGDNLLEMSNPIL